MDNNSEGNQSFQSQSEPQMAPQPEMQPTPQPEMQPTSQPSSGMQGVGVPFNNDQPSKKINTNSMFVIIAAVVALAIFTVIMIVFMDDGKGNTNQYSNNESSQDNQEEQTDVDVSMMQRDTQRRDDMARFVTQINQYQANNRGEVPHQALANSEPVGAYNLFIDEYMKYGGDSFADPLTGEDYEVVKFTECSSDECEDVAIEENAVMGKIYVYGKAKCMDDSLSFIDIERDIAITMALETGGIVCYNN